jgi:hypothetical protein
MYLNEMIQLFESIGYTSALQVLNAEDYGVLQRRRRVIIIGRKGKKKFPFPKIETIENNWQIKKDFGVILCAKFTQLSRSGQFFKSCPDKPVEFDIILIRHDFFHFITFSSFIISLRPILFLNEGYPECSDYCPCRSWKDHPGR